MTNKLVDLSVYLSGIILAASVFFPLTRLPIVGEVSYHRIADVEAYLVVLLSLTATAFVLMGKARLTIVSAIGVWLTFLFPVIEDAVRRGDSGLLSQVTDGATRVMRDFAADIFLNVTEFSWGGYVLVVALAVFSVACSVKTIRG